MKAIKHINALLIAALLCAGICGCKQDTKTTKKITTAKKKIISVPSGAKIFYNGEEIGTTPYILTAKPNSYTVKLVKNGYKTRFANFTVKKGKNSPETFNLAPASSSVLIETVPSKVSIIRDNKRIGETPMVLNDLAFGTYNIRLERSGYSPQDVSFTINSVRPQKITTKLASNIGTVQITSYPSRARIYHNNKYIGMTPLNAEFHDGKHTFVLKLNSYAEVSADIVIQKGTKRKLHRNLTLLPGSFYITSSPSKARVTFDNKYMGMTPLLIKDASSNIDHKISVSGGGYYPQTITRKTSPGKREPVHFVLKRNRGDLELVINPPGVTVYIDNIKRGITQKSDSNKMSNVMLIKNLTPGEHTVRFAHRRARPSSKSFKVEIIPGETTRPKPMSLWIPNAEITFNNDSTEVVIILSESKDTIYVEPYDGIRYTVLKKDVKKINHFKDNE